MSTQIKKRQTLIILMIMSVFAGYSQEVKRTQPVWWFGESGAVNFNTYRGTTQMLNSSTTVPTAFHKGNGIKPYASLLAEYRPGRTWGGMLNIGFDNRGGKFDGVTAPCNCPATLSTNLSYLTFEPSLRLAPFSSAFYIFAGPTVNVNISKKFHYTQEKQLDKRGDWSDIKKTGISAQAGAGIDIPLSAKTSPTQMTLSPFASFLTDFGHEPRTVESWAVYTIRAGIALKFGTAKNKRKTDEKSEAAVIASPEVTPEKSLQFSVEGPKVFPLKGQVKETFPLRNTIFYDKQSPGIPKRYVLLTPSAAKSFREEQLQLDQPDNLTVGRSSRQLAVYHNILNIIGDRMRSNAGSSIAIISSTDAQPAEGKLFAENIKKYLVDVFGISASRITTTSKKRAVTSQETRAPKDLEFLAEGERSVDIESTSPELLLQVGGSSTAFLKPVQITTAPEDALDRQVVFNNVGAQELLDTYLVRVIDDAGNIKIYGPFTKDQASVPANVILGDNTQGNYRVVMTGKRKTGQAVTEEDRVSLVKIKDRTQEGLRYSILFDFDKSKSIDTYETFLEEVVTPLIPNKATVKIHGHTDFIGDEKYNLYLSHERATGVQRIIEKSLLKKGRKEVKFETSAFGSDVGMSPFENTLPEERFYNRTVIIDIIPTE